MQLAPFDISFDMFIALFFCYIPPFVFFYFGLKASKSGSIQKDQRHGMPPGHYEWSDSDQNVSFWKTGQFYIGILWLLFGSLFFWAFLWPDHSDVWFVK